MQDITQLTGPSTKSSYDLPKSSTESRRTVSDSPLQVPVAQMTAAQRQAYREYGNQLVESIDSLRQAPSEGGFPLIPTGEVSQFSNTARASSDTHQNTTAGDDTYQLQIPTAHGNVTATVTKQGPGMIDRLMGDEPEKLEFRVTADGHSFDVICAKSLASQSRAFIQTILEELLKIPKHLRKAVDTIELTDKKNPDDAYWEKKYNIPGFESAACAGDGKVTVWGLTAQNAEGRIRHAMTHEVGHLVGEAVRSDENNFLENLFLGADKYPEDWPRAVKADHNPVDTGLKVAGGRNYSESSPEEDFAEAFKLFVQCKMSGKSSVDSFTSKYPNRARILERIWSAK